ncbi:polymerase [Streptococcus pneumoniae]|uniref:Oligosaccharide repeat unit polymerase Wzy n=1 Tax=Streptococcus pneumoniae TaxID=1313 RepID=Q7WVW7_STREE|nr:putative repeating unit polymerase [Streptococcus pneumoniae]OAB69407.1 polymerase [Streptococcus pneumoniae]OOC99247.1 polymerase [Streptococcus pneumoniae]CAI32797.1 oligosaccharide repeat unit polymerase Wzy [Streptococcus pneumoniae]
MESRKKFVCFPNSSLRFYILQAAIALSILSQTPYIWKFSGIPTQLLIMPLWILLGVVSIFSRIDMERSFLFFLLTIGCLISTIALLDIVTGVSYVFNGLSQQLYLAVGILVLGYWNADVIVHYWKIITMTFLGACLLISVDIYFHYFQGHTFSNIDYVYRAKNSAASIFLSAVILNLSLYNRKWALWRKVLLLASSGLLIYMCILMRSRAVLLAAAVLPLVYIWFQETSLGHKIGRTLGVSTVVGAFLLNSAIYDFFINNLFLRVTSEYRPSSLTLDYVSSNRFVYFEIFAKEISGHELTGIGYYYMDNFFLESFLNYGYIVGTAFVLIALSPMIYALLQRSSSHRFRMLFLALAFSYTVNALFEGYAPFGPGAKSFILWLVFGCLLNTRIGKVGEHSETS